LLCFVDLLFIDALRECGLNGERTVLKALDRIFVLILDGMVRERLGFEIGSEGEPEGEPVEYVEYVDFGRVGPMAFTRVGLVIFPVEVVFLLLRLAYKLMIPSGKLFDDELAGGESIAGKISAEEKSGEEVVTVMLL
jgi:hypothetical protein